MSRGIYMYTRNRKFSGSVKQMVVYLTTVFLIFMISKKSLWSLYDCIASMPVCKTGKDNTWSNNRLPCFAMSSKEIIHTRLLMKKWLFPCWRISGVTKRHWNTNLDIRKDKLYLTSVTSTKQITLSGSSYCPDENKNNMTYASDFNW